MSMDFTPAARKPTSARKVASNQANGSKSRGPITEEGKRRACMNALKHGLTSDLVVLPHEDANEYNTMRERLFRQ